MIIESIYEVAICPDPQAQFYYYWSGTFPVSMAYNIYSKISMSAARKCQDIQLKLIN